MPNSILPKLGPGLARLRTLYGWSQQEFAARIAYSTSYVSEIESGLKTPRLYFIEVCAKAFDLPTWLVFLFIERRTSDIHDLELFVEIKRLNDEIIRSKQP